MRHRAPLSILGTVMKGSAGYLILPAVLCGGSGTRLWPLSRRSLPKQFAPLVGGHSLLRSTCERLKALGDEILVVTGEDHRFSVESELASAGVTGTLILEPCPRNTAAAMALAALSVGASSQEKLLLVCPADHYIPDVASFRNAILRGLPAAQAGAIVTFGVVPAFPSAAYGYIKRGARRPDGSHRVDRFIEKPDAASAEAMLAAGDVYWNAGIFLCSAATLIDALRRHAPDILDACGVSMRAVKTALSPSSMVFLRPEPAAFFS